MIHKEIFTMSDTNDRPAFFSRIIGFLKGFGFEQFDPISPGYQVIRHKDSLVCIAFGGQYSNSFGVSAGYGIDAYNQGVSSPILLNNRGVVYKANNVIAGAGFAQLIICNNGNGNLWFTFNGYNQIDNITGGVVFISGDRGVNTANGNVYEKSTSAIGTVKPIVVNYDALPDKAHISDTYTTDGNFLVEKFPCMKGYASAEMQQYRIYEINGKRYLALPNRLLLEC